MSNSSRSLGQRNSADARAWAAKKLAREAKAKKLREERQQAAHSEALEKPNDRRRPLLASDGHNQTKAYMADFYAALKEMEGPQADGAAQYDDFGRCVQDSTPLGTGSRRALVESGGGRQSSGVHSTRRASSKVIKRSESQYKELACASWDPAIDGGLLESVPEMHWDAGPLDERGVQLDMSDRNVLCMSVNHSGSEVCFGSADHAAYVYSLSDLHGDKDRAQARRQLYSRAYGHSDWVTAVAYSSSGSIYTGGMDGQVLRWDGSSRAEQLVAGGESPVSVLQTLCSRDVCIAGDYRGDLLVFSPDVETRLKLHDAPIMAMDVGRGLGSFVLSGDRNGVVIVSDLIRPEAAPSVLGEHEGHCTCAKVAPGSYGPCAATGGQDGLIKLWDRRSKEGPLRLPAHRRKRNDKLEIGAVADILWRGAESGGSDWYLVSGGADKKMVVSDVRMGRPLYTMKSGNRDFVYCMACYGDTIFAGTGDGMILCHDLKRGKDSLLWGLGGSSAGAVRAVAVVPSQRMLVGASDDGKALVWRFPDGMR